MSVANKTRAVLNPSVPPEGTKVITAEDILKRNE